MNVGVVVGTWTGTRAKSTFRSRAFVEGAAVDDAKPPAEAQKQPAPESTRVLFTAEEPAPPGSARKRRRLAVLER